MLVHRHVNSPETLIPEAPDVTEYAPGPIRHAFERPRLSGDVTYLDTGMMPRENPVLERENYEFAPLDINPQDAPDPIRKGDFVGRPARNPSHAWTYWQGFTHWLEARFTKEFEEGKPEFYPMIQPNVGATFDYSGQAERFNIPYDRPPTYGEQVQVIQDVDNLPYQDLSNRGGY